MTDSIKGAGVERHAITVLTLIIVALILWVGNSVQQNQVELSAIEVELRYIKEAVVQDNKKFLEIEARLDAIETALASHSSNGGHDG
jgi:hypothetical protein